MWPVPAAAPRTAVACGRSIDYTPASLPEIPNASGADAGVMAMRFIPSITADDGAVARRNAWWLLALLIGVWVLEISVVQHWTTLPDSGLGLPRVVKEASRRAVLTVAGCTVVVCMLRGWMLAAAFCLWAVAANVLIAYATYFKAPLSWPVVAHQWQEGLAVSDAGFALVRWSAIALGVGGAAMKLAIACRVSRAALPRRGLQGLAAAAACLYAGMAVFLAGIHKPIDQIRIGTPEYAYGYVVAWGAEMLWLDTEVILAEALDKAAPKSDVLAAVEEPFALGRHVAVVQVESLDFAAVDARVAGELVMPFLNGLRDSSMLYSVRPFHGSGSSEADFSLLMAATPIGRFNPFQVAGFPYADSLPRLARQKGYRPVAFHGNTGAFFRRRPAYEQMGFDKLFFTEELAPRNVTGKWDEELFAFSAQMLATAEEPALHFVITITSHSPFDRLPRDKRELFPDPRTIEQRYLNSMRYIDTALARYVGSVPMGTTIVIYGDHESQVTGYDPESAHENRVPWFIFEKGRDLSGRQRSRENGLALSGKLTQLDMACFLRDRMAGTRPAAEGGRQAGEVIASGAGGVIR